MTIMHGIKTNLLQSGTAAITPVSSAVIGLIATGGVDTDAGTFPLDRPVLLTDVRAALAKVGTTGTLGAALAAIVDQCNPLVIVVRVAVNVDPAQQDTLVEGTTAVNGTYTGAKALLAAEAITGVRPRILGAPGLDTHGVITALIPIAKQLRAMIYAHATGAAVADVDTFAGGFGDREICLLWPETSNGAGDMVARALGIRAAIDQSTGWQKSLSNVVVEGIDGLSHDVSWTLSGDSGDASVLNGANVTTMIRRGGFRFWGNRTCSTIPQYAFEVATRTSQILADEIEGACFQFADQPLTAGLVKTILSNINARFRALKAIGRLIGATAWYDPALNSSEALAAGQLVLDYDFTPVAPLEGLTENQRITDRYYADFGAQIAVA